MEPKALVVCGVEPKALVVCGVPNALVVWAVVPNVEDAPNELDDEGVTELKVFDVCAVD